MSKWVATSVRMLPLLGVMTGTGVMVGWFYDWEWAKSLIVGKVTMKFTTALCFALAGLMGMIGLSPQRTVLREIVVGIGAMLIGTVMLSQLVANVAAQPSLWDTLFVQPDLGGEQQTVTPGRPSVGTMTAFFLYSIMGVTWTQGFRGVALWLGRAVMAIGCLGVAGYVLGLPHLYYYFKDASTAMAVHTAILFTILGMHAHWCAAASPKTKGEAP